MALQMHEATGKTVGVIDGDGTVIACSELRRIGEVYEMAVDELNNTSEPTVYRSFTFKSLAMRRLSKGRTRKRLPCVPWLSSR